VERSILVLRRTERTLEVELAGGIQRLSVFESGADMHLFRDGHHATLRLSRAEDALEVTAGAEEGSLLTPLPGTVVAVHVSAGQRVARGAPLITVEAMKMEHTLTAPHDGMVERVVFALGDRVAAGAVLVELSAVKAD
jgi:3-methylcrotonyl-CoA carboxylase alpha subunit